MESNNPIYLISNMNYPRVFSSSEILSCPGVDVLGRHFVLSYHSFHRTRSFQYLVVQSRKSIFEGLRPIDTLISIFKLIIRFTTNRIPSLTIFSNRTVTTENREHY